MTDAIVIGGSRGIGRAIAESLRTIGCNVLATSRKQIDTSDLESVRKFAGENKETDIIVLNTGGPPPKEFGQVTIPEWSKYHNQLFLGFCLLLDGIKIRSGGYIFLISSGVIREPSPKLVISGAYRSAFSNVLKTLSKDYAKRGISCINIAPGLVSTDRTKELFEDAEAIAASLPMGRMGRPDEIGSFVKGIVQGRIKYLSGVTIHFDGANSSCV